MHVLNNSSLAIVLQLVFNALLSNEALPIQLALAYRVDLSTAVIYGAHHVIQILICYMGLSTLKFFRIVFGL